MLKQTLKDALKTFCHPFLCLLNTFCYSVSTDKTIPYSWELWIQNHPQTAEQTRHDCIEWLAMRANQIDPLDLAIGYPAVYLVKNGFRIHRLTEDEIAFILKMRNNE